MTKRELLAAVIVTLVMAGAWLYDQGVLFPRSLERESNPLQNSASISRARRFELGLRHQSYLKAEAPNKERANLQSLMAARPRIASLQSCLKSSHGCFGFEGLSDRARRFAAAVELKKELLALQRWVAEDPELRTSQEIERLARRLALSSEDRVKEGAYELLALYEPNAKNLRAVLAGLRTSNSAPLHQRAATMLVRYRNSSINRRQIVQFLREKLLGPVNLAVPLAENLKPFLDTNSRSIFEKTYNQLPKDSPVHQKLALQLRSAHIL